jgi:hypothetical protein
MEPGMAGYVLFSRPTRTTMSRRPERGDDGMTFSDVLKGYEGFTRRLAAKAGSRVDAWMGSPRRIHTETSNFVLGAEAIPAPVFRSTGLRR